MRRNLDQSEAAIIQVFEEKQRVWERQMDELRQNYASRLQQVTSIHTSTKQQAALFPLTSSKLQKQSLISPKNIYSFISKKENRKKVVTKLLSFVEELFIRWCLYSGFVLIAD